jgi:hypothetical protein
MDRAANVAFFVVHTAWMVFVCVGWAWARTRAWHLAAIVITALSWFGLGAWYGWGYCPCTDWHWAIRERLGYVDPPSYTQLLIASVTTFEPTTFTANAITLAVFLGAAILSVVTNAGRRRGRA